MRTNELTLSSASPQTGAEWTCWADAGENVLIAAAQAGITEAFDELLARHRVSLYRAARRFRLSHEDAEDLVQESALRALIHLGTFRHESNFSTWLIAILNNSFLSLKRRGKRVRWCSLDRSDDPQFIGSWEIPDERVDPEQEAIRRELLTFLQAVVLKQSRQHRIILKNCLLESKSIQDLAPLLGLTLSSAKSSLFRAKRKVADSFVRRGIVNQRRNRNQLRANQSAKGR